MIFRVMIGMGLMLFLASHSSEFGLGRSLGLEASGAGLPSLVPSPSPGQRSLADVKREIDASLKARGRPFYDL